MPPVKLSRVATQPIFWDRRLHTTSIGGSVQNRSRRQDSALLRIIRWCFQWDSLQLFTGWANWQAVATSKWPISFHRFDTLGPGTLTRHPLCRQCREDYWKFNAPMGHGQIKMHGRFRAGLPRPCRLGGRRNEVEDRTTNSNNRVFIHCLSS